MEDRDVGPEKRDWTDLPWPAHSLVYQHASYHARKQLLAVSRWARDVVLQLV
jgi:hypothetical protein